MIDYVIGDEETRDKMKRMEMGDRVESDRHPLVVPIREGKWERGEKKK